MLVEKNIEKFFSENIKKISNENYIEVTNLEYDKSLNTIQKFYKFKPFPNYKINDNKHSILQIGNSNPLASQFKSFIGLNKTVLEAGCGTGQLSNYLAIGTNNKVFGLDATSESLNLASSFAKKNNLKNITFVKGDITQKIFNDEMFDFIWCSGVLHHTRNARLGFEILSKSLKKNGYFILGLYNSYGRIRTIVRRFFFKIFGVKFIKILDPYLRQLNKNYKNNKDKIESWINDQYLHPIETCHSINEVIDWFNSNNINFISSVPSLNFYENDLENKFQKQNIGTTVSRILKQLTMNFQSFGSEGGLFVVIGKKNDNSK